MGALLTTLRKKPIIAAGDNSLQAIIASCCGDLDVTQPASYPGSGQKLFNMVPSPNDGLLTADSDFYFGADGTVQSSDPTPVGSGSSAYLDFDGGDWLSSVGTALYGSGTCLGDTHKRGAAFWSAVVLYIPTGAAGRIPFIATGHSSDNTTGLSIEYQIGNNKMGISVSDGTSNKTDSFTTATEIPRDDYILVLTTFDSGSNDCDLYVGSATLTETKTNTRYTTTSVATGAYIYTDPNPTYVAPNGIRLVSNAWGDSYVGSTEYTALATALGLRHGRAY